MKRHTLEDIKSVEDIEGLTVRQMKEVLVKNFVDYKGCVEKSELQDRVTRLWKEHQVNKQKSEYCQGNRVIVMETLGCYHQHYIFLKIGSLKVFEHYRLHVQ